MAKNYYFVLAATTSEPKEIVLSFARYNPAGCVDELFMMYRYNRKKKKNNTTLHATDFGKEINDPPFLRDHQIVPRLRLSPRVRE